MADKFEQGGNFQIVFLIDVFVEEQNICEQDLEDILNLKSRAISLCVLRLLLHFNSVVECGNFAPLKWGFKFYNSSVLNFEYKRRRFYELNSGSFEQFEEEMRQRFTNACSSQNSAKTAGVKSLSCCLTEILHDFPWVTPDISSPSRSAKYDQFNSQRKKRRNYLFVVGDCPLSDADMCRFLGRNESSFDAEVMFKEIFSTALYEEFHSKCGLSLFWIDSGLWCVAPEKLKTSVEDWKGYSLISCVTKQLCGNIVPISSLIQDTRSICLPHLENSTLSPKGFKLKANTLAEVRVMAAAFKFSFGKTVEAFLSGKDLISEAVINDVKLIPNSNGLLKGILCFQEKRVCSVVLSHVLQKKSTSTHGECSSNIETHRPDDIDDHNHDNVNVEKPSSDDNSSLAAYRQTLPDLDPKTNNEVNGSTSTNGNIELKTERESFENCFVIEGVIASADVSPSWMHPTKLYSCFSGETLNSGVVENTEDAGLFQQMLSLIGSKSLSMVIEYQDPDASIHVTGLLQPITQLCAILSMVKEDKLLLVEKALLRHRSRGYILVPCDVTSDKGDSKTLPFDLQENKEEFGNDEGIGSTLSKPKDWNGSEKDITHSYICSFQKKKLKERESGKELRLKLKDYYSKKESKSNSEKSAVQALALTRGKLLQETSQKNITSKLNESEPQNKIVDSAMETEDSTATLSNLDSEQTDAMDEDLPDMSVIQSVDDLKTKLENEYQRCLNQEQSVTVYVSCAFQMILHFKHSGQLKDVDEIDSLLKSTVLRDGKKSREISDAEKNESDKERVVLEYKLQVFLRLEFADKIGVVDEEKMADEITSVLRAISFQKDPAYLSSFLKNSVIPRYADNLSSLLCQVYDGLMQRPPKEILSPSQVTSEEDTPLKSRKTLSSSKKAKSVEEAHSESSQSSRTLVRRHSVMGVPAKRREIVIPVKGKSNKTRKKTASAGKKSGKKHTMKKKPVTPVKKVRRNLFEGNGSKSSPKKHSKIASSKSERGNLTRRHSIAAFSKSNKVADTPMGKQVSQRMLRRQEWARRRSKTVTDVTVVGESPQKDDAILPRKSPRRKAATFYSASQRAPSTAKTTNKNFSTSAECTAEDKIDSVPDNKSSRTLHRAKSMNMDTGFDTVSSPRKKYTKLLSTDESSPKLDKDDSFAEVFLETGDANERTILSACTSDRQGDVTSGQHIVRKSPGDTCDDPNLPLSTSKKPSRKHNMSTECPSSVTPNKSTTSPLTAVRSSRSVSQRSNSSPSLSTTPPLKPSKSPLITHKSFPTTSPVLFKSPKTTPKSSPINFSPEQIFDITIPLVPVKSPLVRPKTDSTKNSRLKTSPLRKSDKVMASPSECVRASSEVVVGDVGTESEIVGLKSENVVKDSESVVKDSESVGNDSESVVAVSPLLNRKRSSISSATFLRSKTSLNFGNSSSPRSRGVDSDPTTYDVTNQEGDFPTASNAEVQRPGVEFDNEVLDSTVAPEQTEVFKSPVTTKRKRIGSTRTGNVSPLNQILKQRKNNRNTPPGTPRSDTCKLERTENSNSCKGETQLKQISIRRKQKIKSETADAEETDRGQLDSSPFYVSDDNLSPDKTNLNLSARQQRNTKLVSSPCNLKAHFTPMSLSADSLKHLQESPVLLGSSPQSSDSRTRKWSERKSPLSTSQHSLRKRIRHDS